MEKGNGVTYTYNALAVELDLLQSRIDKIATFMRLYKSKIDETEYKLLEMQCMAMELQAKIIQFRIERTSVKSNSKAGS